MIIIYENDEKIWMGPHEYLSWGIVMEYARHTKDRFISNWFVTAVER